MNKVKIGFLLISMMCVAMMTGTGYAILKKALKERIKIIERRIACPRPLFPSCYGRLKAQDTCYDNDDCGYGGRCCDALCSFHCIYPTGYHLKKSVKDSQDSVVSTRELLENPPEAIKSFQEVLKGSDEAQEVSNQSLHSMEDEGLYETTKYSHKVVDDPLEALENFHESLDNSYESLKDSHKAPVDSKKFLGDSLVNLKGSRKAAHWYKVEYPQNSEKNSFEGVNIFQIFLPRFHKAADSQEVEGFQGTEKVPYEIKEGSYKTMKHIREEADSQQAKKCSYETGECNRKSEEANHETAKGSYGVEKSSQEAKESPRVDLERSYETVAPEETEDISQAATGVSYKIKERHRRDVESSHEGSYDTVAPQEAEDISQEEIEVSNENKKRKHYAVKDSFSEDYPQEMDDEDTENFSHGSVDEENVSDGTPKSSFGYETDCSCHPLASSVLIMIFLFSYLYMFFNGMFFAA